MNAAIRAMLDIAEHQEGIVRRADGSGSGLNDAQMDACVRSGLLIPVSASGLYRVRGAPQTLAMATAAAVLGSGGAASCATSARLLRFDAPLPPSPLHVRVSEGHPRLRRIDVETAQQAFFAVEIHRSLATGATITVDGLACTDAARTLLDIAPDLGAEALETVFERARKLGLLTTESLARRFAAVCGPGRPGTRQVRELLAHAAPNPLDSKLEVKAWRLLRSSSIPNPVRQFPVVAGGQRYRLDFAWPDLLATFETEGFEWHGTKARWKQDRRRIAALERLGWRHMIATWDDVVRDPVATLERVALMVAERELLRGA